MSDTATSDRDRTKDHGLKRVIGPGLLFLFNLGDMLGGGIYTVAGEVGGAVWSAFIGAFVLAALTASPTWSWSPGTRAPPVRPCTSTSRSRSRS